MGYLLPDSHYIETVGATSKVKTAKPVGLVGSQKVVPRAAIVE